MSKYKPFRKCTVEGCNNGQKSRGLCAKHYERLRAHGDVNVRFPNQQKSKPCTVEGCSQPIISRGWCRKHYYRWHRHGDTDSLIPNYGRGWHVHKQGYIRIWVPAEKRYKMEHVILAEKALGKPLPRGAIIHHMNEDPADNHTPFNLIICPDQAYHFLIHRRMREYAARQLAAKKDE